MVSYKKLFHYLTDNDLPKGILVDKCVLSWTTVSKLREGGYVNIEVIERICLGLDLKIEDIVEIKKSPGN